MTRLEPRQRAGRSCVRRPVRSCGGGGPCPVEENRRCGREASSASRRRPTRGANAPHHTGEHARPLKLALASARPVSATAWCAPFLRCIREHGQPRAAAPINSPRNIGNVRQRPSPQEQDVLGAAPRGCDVWAGRMLPGSCRTRYVPWLQPQPYEPKKSVRIGGWQMGQRRGPALPARGIERSG